MQGGRLRERVAFDAPTMTDDGYGGQERGWTQVYACRAEFIYTRGAEEVEASRLAGMASYKVRIRGCDAARAIRSDYRMRDIRRGTAYNVRQIDSISDPHHVYFVVESGVAV